MTDVPEGRRTDIKIVNTSNRAFSEEVRRL